VISEQVKKTRLCELLRLRREIELFVDDLVEIAEEGDAGGLGGE